MKKSERAWSVEKTYSPGDVVALGKDWFVCNPKNNALYVSGRHPDDQRYFDVCPLLTSEEVCELAMDYLDINNPDPDQDGEYARRMDMEWDDDNEAFIDIEGHSIRQAQREALNKRFDEKANEYASNHPAPRADLRMHYRGGLRDGYKLRDEILKEDESKRRKTVKFINLYLDSDEGGNPDEVFGVIYATREEADKRQKKSGRIACVEVEI